MTRICLIGLGEVGAILADDLLRDGITLSAWDVQFPNAASKPSAAARARNIRIGANAVDAATDANLVISAVTAAQTLNAANSAATGLRRDAHYLDLNSASPGAKIDASNIINGCGGRYVEAALMSPIGPKRIASPMLLGGRFADEAAPILQQIGFGNVSVYSERYGHAAAAKLCRSVVVKGIEAILIEALTAAEHYDVRDTVIASLSDLFPHQDWNKTGLYMISRAVEHGARRAEEMREAAQTVAEAGLVPFMSAATAQRQDWAATLDAPLPARDLSEFLQAIRSKLGGADT